MGKHDAEHVKHNRNTPRSTKKTLISLHEEETPIIKKEQSHTGTVKNIALKNENVMNKLKKY